jgi:uncharacterized membrane protein YgdD (TMEM256/DUF423 family)
MGAPSIPQQSPNTPSTGPPELKCRTCGAMAAPYGEIGFCAYCGEPLCPSCYPKNMVEAVDSETSRTWLVVASINKTTQVKIGVTACMQCKERIEHHETKGIKIGLAGGLIAFFVLLVLLVYFSMMQFTWFGFCFSCGMGIAVCILIFYILVMSKEQTKGPFCPVCGTMVMKQLLEAAKTSGQKDGSMPNYIQCWVCGYTGALHPYEGLWRFVAKYGPGPLAHTVVGRLSEYSYNFQIGKRG